MQKTFTVSTLCIAVLLIGCGGGSGGKSGGAGASGALPQQPIASAVIDHNGGKTTVSDPASPYDGTTVDIPSGALTKPKTITINPLPNISPIVGALPVDFGPDGTTFTTPVTITVPYSDTLTQTYDEDPQDLLIFSRRINGEYEVHNVTGLDQTRRLVTATTTHFSPEEAKFSQNYIFFEQPRTFFDSTPAPYKITTRHVLMPGGMQTQYYPVIVYDAIPTSVPLGKGSLASFWKGGQRNLLLIHGLQSSPPTFLFFSDNPNNPIKVHRDGLLWSLRNDPAFVLYDNIILYQYPSGKAVAENAQWLADAVKKNAQTGFKTDIIAHSMGGIVARSAIEQFGLSPYVERLITLGSPHEGGRLGDYTAYITNKKITATFVKKLYPGIADILEGSGNNFLEDRLTGLNTKARITKPATTEYYLVVGKKTASSDNDGLVKVTSAAPSYLVATPNHTETFNNVEHSELHTKARTNGVLIKIREWVTGLSNTAPIANAGPDQTVITGTTVTLDGSGSSDPDKDTLTYAWTQTAGPTTTLSSTTTATATFTPTQTGVYAFELTASDTVLTNTDTVTITVNPLPPVVPGKQTFVPALDTYQSTSAMHNAQNPQRDIYQSLLAGNTQSGVDFWAEITFGVAATIPANATIVSATLTLEADPGTTSGGATFTLTNGTSPLQTFAAWGFPNDIDVTSYVQTQVQKRSVCFFTIEGQTLFDYGTFYASEDSSKRGPTLTIEWR